MLLFSVRTLFQDLLSCSLTEFEALWEEIEELSRKRQRCIKELDASLKTLEEERMCLVSVCVVFINHSMLLPFY